MGQSADTACGEAAVVRVVRDCVGLAPPGEGPPRGAVSAEPASGRDGAARAPDALPPRAGLSPGSHGRGWEGSAARLGLPEEGVCPGRRPRSPRLLTAPARAGTRLRGRLSFHCPARPDQALRRPGVGGGARRL